MKTSLIMGLSLVHVSETTSSGAMECEGLRRILNDYDDKGVTVSLTATDRSPQVRSMLRRDFPAIRHQFHVWHFAKSVTKKLHKVAEKKMFHRLRQWIPAIQNPGCVRILEILEYPGK